MMPRHDSRTSRRPPDGVSIDRVSDEVGQFRFITTERLLISGRHHALSAVEAARTKIAAALLELIVEHVTDAIAPIVDELQGELDRIEDCPARGADAFERTSWRASGAPACACIGRLRPLPSI